MVGFVLCLGISCFLDATNLAFNKKIIKNGKSIFEYSFSYSLSNDPFVDFGITDCLSIGGLQRHLLHTTSELFRGQIN